MGAQRLLPGSAGFQPAWERRLPACMACAVVYSGRLQSPRLAGWKPALPGLRNRLGLRPDRICDKSAIENMPDENKSAGAMPKLLLALSQLPLVGGAALWWEKIQQRPVAAALIAVAYEALLLIAAFGKKVWAKLEDEAVQRTADWIKTGISNFKPGFRRRYKQQIIRDHGIFNVRGLGLLNTYTLKLEEVFVDLRIAPSSNPSRPSAHPVERKKFAGNLPVWDFLRVKTQKKDDALALAIIGPPGCGKTTLLRHVALTLAGNRQRRYHSRAYTPIFLFLRDHVAAITGENPPAIGPLAQKHFSNQSVYSSLHTPDHWFEKQVDRGKCIILLDGLDEIADAQKRRAVAAWIDNQIRNYPACRFIITARPQGYLDAPLERASILLEVQLFNSAQVKKFIENWYLANEIKSSGNVDNAEVRRRAASDANDLMRRLRGLPALSALTVNPLLLTMIAMVHRFKGSLPGKRVGLYVDICEVLLGRWRETIGLSDTMSAPQKLTVLRPLAAEMMERRVRDIRKDEAIAIIEPMLKRVGFADRAENFLTNLETGSGLFLEREPGLWSFAHLTFQEYLTGAHWLEQKSEACNWVAMVDDSWWHETLRLYAAQGDATPVVRACLEKDTLAALTLAADCLEEALIIETEIRSATFDRLIADLESFEPARRRLAREVKLSRRLKSPLHPMDEQRAIDVFYLTCSEYQLFIDEMHTLGAYHQPDHWADFSFNSGGANEPVTGVRAEDAKAFCEWLTNRYGENLIAYRLPLLEEARQFPSDNTSLAAWCKTTGGISQLTGLETVIEQNLKQQLATLSNSKLKPLQSLTRDLGSNLTRDFDLARDLNLDLDLAFTLARALAFALTRARALARTVDLARDHALAFDRALALALARARDRALDRAFDLDRARGLVRELTLDLARDLARAHDRAHNLTIFGIIDSIVTTISSGNLPEAARLSQYLQNDPNGYISRLGSLLNGILTAVSADTPLTMRQAQRRYTLRLLEFAYIGFEELNRMDVPPWWQRLLRRRREDKSIAEAQQDTLDLYWWLQIVLAREEGKLPAWEGIRIVRESVQAQAAAPD